MASLFFDGDVRRIYEVPDNSSFVLNGAYRVYTPNDIPSAPVETFTSVSEVWSRWVDYHDANKWALLAFSRQGGAFRFLDEDSNSVFATADFRLINDWQLVPADYPHKWWVVGNLLPNLATGEDFDTTRITSLGVSPRIRMADSLQRVVVSDVTLSEASRDDLAERNRDVLLSTETQNPGPAGSIRTHTPEP